MDMKNNNRKIVILAYPGTGKTVTSQKLINVIDFEHQDYRYIYDESIRHLPLEQRKGSSNLRKDNPDWPNNFINAAVDLLNQGKILISPFVETVFRAFDNDMFRNKASDVRIIIACPTEDSFNEIIERYKSRGNSEQFIQRRIQEFPIILKLFNSIKKYEKISISSGQYLIDALEEYGIKFSDDNNLE